MMLTILLLLALPLLATGFTAWSRSLEKSYLATLVTRNGAPGGDILPPTHAPKSISRRRVVWDRSTGKLLSADSFAYLSRGRTLLARLLAENAKAGV